MKYTARHVKKFMEQGEIDPDLWMKHFPAVLPSRVPACSDCEDYKAGCCAGGKEPVECFLAIGIRAEEGARQGASGRKNARFRWSGTGKDGSVPANANKVFDQSKE
jgi:hypothetical protein